MVTSRVAMVFILKFMEFKELGKHRVFLGFYNTHGFQNVHNFDEHFLYNYRNKQAYLWIFTNVFKSSFQKISDFLVVFKMIQNIALQIPLMNSPTFHMLTFFKILVFSGNQ